VNPTSRYTISEKVTWKDLGENVVVLNLFTSEYYTLNETASIIWRALVQGNSAPEIQSLLLEVFDAEPGTINDALQSNLDEWAAEGVIIPAV
jgi:hypothetical protein